MNREIMVTNPNAGEGHAPQDPTADCAKGEQAAIIGEEVAMNPPEPTSMRRVLLVEDDDVLRSNYETLLRAHQLSVCGCATKSEAIVAFSQQAFDVVILDVTLGGEYEAGFDLCLLFREKQKFIPII